MRLFIKNMISLSAKTRALAVLKSLGLHPEVADIGEVEIPDNVSSKKYDLLKRALRKEDFDLIKEIRSFEKGRIFYLNPTCMDTMFAFNPVVRW